ncbi:MMPL family transporter [Nocardioides sp.]|uniref:MMPL family transporter n=1 Tax=Nocardioides sp. TaxID=35761 RepID=UPI0026292010|nr:MMPL family transporter [Nocardioides sp.]
MATLLHRLGTTAFRRWRLFLAGWLALLIGLGAFAAAFSEPLSEEVSIPGIPSEEAADLQAELFPGAESAFDSTAVNVVIQAPRGERLDDRRWQREITSLSAAIADLPQQAQDPIIVGPVEGAAQIEEQLVGAARSQGGGPESIERARANAAALSPLTDDGRTGILTFEWDADSPVEVEPTTIDELEEVMAEARESGLRVEANGPGASPLSPPEASSEALGLAVALIVLVLTFGSLMAAGMPLFNAIIGVAIGLAGVTGLTAFLDINQSATILATMIGIAVGIDYTLFILARYRTELHHTDDREAAVGVAVGTAGSAVVFAGLTVLIALSALSVVRIPFLTVMGLAAAATVTVAVLVALTLLPALLGMLGKRAFGGRVRRYQPAREADGQILNNGVRWARLIRRAPLAVIAVTVIGLASIAIPLKDLQLAFPTDSTAPADTTQRKASDLIADAFGPGREGPLLVVVDARDVAEQERQTAFQEVADWAGGQDGVTNAQVVATNAEVTPRGDVRSPATGALVQVVPEFGPESSEAQDLLADLREGEDAIEQETGTDTGVTGLTAITTDVSDRLGDALPIYLAIVIGLAFILLILVFRSILVPLTATLGFLLSVLATLGATVAVFSQGAFGLFEGQPIVSFMPIFLIGLVFGLAMDYQVFLVTRMREAHVHGRSTAEAVIDGFRNSARVVTAAATIMIAVFAAFMLQEDAIIKSMGFALAAAIVFDAFIVRMALIPALLFLLGERAWWIPTWLDKILPNVDVEGEKLQRPHLAAGGHALSETDLDEAADDSDVLV